MATIRQRITLEGGDELKKQLEALGKAGEQSFKQIQDAAQKTQVDPQRFAQTEQAIKALGATSGQLAAQFQQLANAATAFGTQGQQATAQVTAGLNQTNAAAAQTTNAFGALLAVANRFRVAIAGIAGAAGLAALTKGAADTGAAIADQADKLKLSVQQWMALRAVIAGTGGSIDNFVKGAGTAIDLLGKLKEETAAVSRTYKVLNEAGEEVTVTMTSAGAAAKKAASGLSSIMQTGDTVAILREAANQINRLNDSALQRTPERAAEATKALQGMGVSLQTILRRDTVGMLREVVEQIDKLAGVKGEVAETTKAFLDLGVSLATLRGGDTLAILRATAEAINRIPEGAKQAAAGVKFFGDNWKEVVKTLTSGKAAIEDQRKASRELTTQQVETAKKVKDAWSDLGAAIRATRDQVGALFLSSELKRTEWLTNLVDDSRELLKTWLGLSSAGREGFMQDLADSPAATAFRILVALGEQLAGIWNDALVPAGKKLLEIVSGIAANFDGVTSAQVIAGFIAAAAAVTALAVAFKGIGFVLSPLTAVISLLVGWGPILVPLIALVALFWDQFVAGAQAAAELIPNSLAAMGDAFRLLLQGDFAGFWANFSAAAVVAFQTIQQAIARTEWGQAIASVLTTIKEQVPGTITLIIDGLFALGRAAQFVADTINKLFGTKLTGTDIAVIVIIGMMTGAFVGLAAAISIVSGSLSILISTISLLGSAFTAFSAGAAALAVLNPMTLLVLAGILALVAALALLIIYWPQIKQAAIDAWVSIKQGALAARQFIEDWVTTPVANAWQWIVDAWNAMLKKLGFGGETPEWKDPGGIPGNAAGGLLGGRGTGTSDSNLAWVSRGEFITPARAVAQPGVLAFLEALRRTGGDLRSVLDGMGRFALGGLVAPRLAIPAMAGGGMNHVTINFPGLPEITGLRASSAVVDELRKAAALSQVRSGGRKPSRWS